MDVSFTHAPIQVPKLSGFDKSHQNLLTSKCGTITPILVDPLIPGTKVNLRIAASACLPPLASDTFMRVSLKMHAFFVPYRLLVASFESFFCQSERPFINSGTPPTFNQRQGILPYIQVPVTANVAPSLYTSKINVSGSLMDYLGYRPSAIPNGTYTFAFSPLSALAYHKIWDDWFRAPLIQNSIFGYEDPGGGAQKFNVGVWPSSFFYSASPATATFILGTDDAALSFSDGVSLFDLRQANFGFDYFTTATPTPQNGSAQVVSFSTSGSTGNFSIASLRASNSLQQYAERQNLAGGRFQDNIKAMYGVDLSNGVAQRTLYLGSAEFEVYSKGIYQNSQTYDSTNQSIDSSTTNNPFSGATGASFGSARASGSSFVIKGFQANEPGFLFVTATLVPRVTYSSGIRHYLLEFLGATPGAITDLANPILQNVGPQPIYQSELSGLTVPLSTGIPVFGYTDRYASYKTVEDGLHGILRDGQSLQAFALQRSFSSINTISSSFLEIPTNYMDQVTAISSTLSSYGYWADFFFDYKVAMPLSKYSLPSLQDPAYEHGKTIVVAKGGARL